MAQDPEDNGASRYSLYNRYRQAAGRRDAKEFFDEDDLIDIYDYANDVNDDFVRLEVLFDAASRYPDSRELLDRRRYFYYYLGNDDAVDKLLEDTGSQSVLSRLLTLRRKSDRGEATFGELERILATLDHKLNDEEVIQFLSEASTPENYDWLVRNFDKVRACARYQQTLLYEMSSLAIEHSDNVTSVAMAEELTMLEPFNIEFWELLAEAEYHAMDFQGVLTAVDYALAIDPTSEKSLKIKAWALYQLDEDSAEAESILLSMSDRESFDSLSMRILVLMLDKKGDCQRAAEIASKYIERNPNDRTIQDYLLVADPDNLTERVDALPEAPEMTAENYWVEWALKHANGNEHNVAAEILLRAHREDSLREYTALLYEELYRAGRYDEVLELFVDDAASAWNKRVEVFLAVIMSFVRLDRYDDARRVLDEIRAGSDGQFGEMFLSGMHSRMFAVIYARGGMSLMRGVYDALNAPEKLPADDFDPFV